MSKKAPQVPLEYIPFVLPASNNANAQQKDYQKMGRGVLRVGITFSAANTDKVINHGLGRIPTGYADYRRSGGGQIYEGTNLGTDWTVTNIVLRCTGTDTHTIYIF